jgi:hypothetical protein
MNIIHAALVTLALIAITTTAWYITQPLASQMIDISSGVVNDTVTDSSLLEGANNTWNLTRLAVFVWGPALDVVYVLWFVFFGTKESARSDYRRY